MRPTENILGRALRRLGLAPRKTDAPIPLAPHAQEIRVTPFSEAFDAAVEASGLLPLELDQLARDLARCTCFGDLIGREPGAGPNGYVPSISRTTPGGRALIEAYNAARAAQGDPRRAG